MNFRTPFSLFLILVLISFISCEKDDENIIELPLTEIRGFGKFNPNFTSISPFNLINKETASQNKSVTPGVPAHWTNVRYGAINTNMYQSAYLDMISGKRTSRQYKDLQTAWNWVPDTNNLSKININSDVEIAFGIDSTGIEKILVDVNNNQDFSDDKSFAPIHIPGDKAVISDSNAIINSIDIHYETVENSKVKTKIAPLLIVYLENQQVFLSSFPRHFQTAYKGKTLKLFTDKFNWLTSENARLCIDTSTGNANEIYDKKSLIEENEYIRINDNLYKHNGVKNQVLRLQKVPSESKISSSQVGFIAHPFTVKNTITGKKIALSDFKEKYLLLNFWGVWCIPCIRKLPDLERIYRSSNRTHFDILSIAVKSKKNHHLRLIKEYNLTWYHAHATDSNNLKKLFGVTKYPYNFVINPEGKIVAKDVSITELQELLDEKGLLLNDTVQATSTPTTTHE